EPRPLSVASGRDGGQPGSAAPASRRPRRGRERPAAPVGRGHLGLGSPRHAPASHGRLGDGDDGGTTARTLGALAHAAPHLPSARLLRDRRLPLPVPPLAGGPRSGGRRGDPPSSVAPAFRMGRQPPRSLGRPRVGGGRRALSLPPALW